MIGYIKTYQPELKMKDLVRYNAYYCGVCHAIKKDWGQIPRLTLNYDCVFIALFIDSFKQEQLNYENFRCPVHPVIKKKKLLYNESLEFTADINVYLTYLKFLDNIKDEGGFKYKSGEKYLRKLAKDIEGKYPDLVSTIKDYMIELHSLEESGSDNLDEVSHCYAQIVRDICIYQLKKLNIESDILSLAGTTAYNLGKWVYTIDAYEDMEEDIKNNSYNPFLKRFDYTKEESLEDFKQRIFDRATFILYSPLQNAATSYGEIELIDDTYIDPLLQNILYEGLYSVTEKILEGEEKIGKK